MSSDYQYPLNALAVAVMYVCFGSMSYGEDKDDDDAIDLGQVTVLGERDAKSHEEKHNQVYDRSISSVYRDKAEIERFKGAAPADMFKGMVGVNSGDARNSGALDPNVRGIQGQGRVPVTIDGTEQAITVWRGYSGANNRNFVDPMLIGGVTVEKGPGLTRGINSSVGGAIAMTTLGIDDIVAPDENWGMDIKVEASNNAVKPKIPNLNQPVPDFLYSSMMGPYMISYYDPAVMIKPRSSGQSKFGNDQAIRFAIGKKWEQLDLLAAYVYRKKGNHFAGRNGARKYAEEEENPQDLNEYWNNYTKRLSTIYKPGMEVPNTSNEMQSVLLKGTWRPTDNQAIELGLRHSWGKYGEIMPSRVANHLGNLDTAESSPILAPIRDYMKDMRGRFPQWPLAEIRTSAVYINHKWDPENPYIDLETNIWGTNTVLDSHTGGGYPRQFYTQWSGRKDEWRSTSATNSKNKRWGVTTSNKMELHPKLDLTIGGSFQHETLKSKDNWYYDPVDVANSSFRALPREGWRKEWNMNFNFDWRPTSWLDISIGAQKTGYSSYDEQLNKQRRARNSQYASRGGQSIFMNYEIDSSKQLLDAHKKFEQEEKRIRDAYGYTAESAKMVQKIQDQLSQFEQEYLAEHGLNGKLDYDRRKGNFKGVHQWDARDDGKFYGEDNPFKHLASDSDDIKTTGYHRDNRAYSGSDPFAPIPKQSNSGDWQPVLAATAWISDNARFYARFAKTERMPNMFESTVGFSATPAYRELPLKPERGTNIELGYVHDLSELLGADRYADVKVSWFKNTIKDVIDRDDTFTLKNIDKQVVSGLELQSRYDNGRFFADFSASYFLKNQVCDRSTALLMDPINESVPECVKDGFYNGYLRNMTPPKYAMNLTLGGRFYDDKLELGTRILHHAGSKNTDKENFSSIDVSATNVPIHWKGVTTVDAWVNYKFDKNTSLEVVATNLTNQYYLDPLTRSHFPAPGRTIRVGFNIKF